MDSLIDIGSKIDKPAMESYIKGITTILQVGAKERTEQKTICCALNALRTSFEVSDVSISDCNLNT